MLSRNDILHNFVMAIIGMMAAGIMAWQQGETRFIYQMASATSGLICFIVPWRVADWIWGKWNVPFFAKSEFATTIFFIFSIGVLAILRGGLNLLSN